VGWAQPGPAPASPAPAAARRVATARRVKSGMVIRTWGFRESWRAVRPATCGRVFRGNTLSAWPQAAVCRGRGGILRHAALFFSLRQGDRGKIKLAKPPRMHIFRLAQFRTCLWSCVGWRRSGQEAGHPSEKTGSRSEPANPAKRGTRLKATTDRAFSSLSALQRPAYRRGLSFLPGVRRGAHPIPSEGHHTLDSSAASAVLLAEVDVSTAQHPIACSSG
jgi:hypothetical protein